MFYLSSMDDKLISPFSSELIKDSTNMMGVIGSMVAPLSELEFNYDEFCLRISSLRDAD